MQFLSGVKQTVTQFAEDNAAALLTAGGVVGTVATGILAGRAGFKAATIIKDRQLELVLEDEGEITEVDFPRPEIPTKERILLVGVHVLPPVLAGGATIGAIIWANRISASKAAALAAAYGLAERNLSEYKAKVEEKLTGPKRQAIGEEISQDRVNRAGEPPTMVIVGDDVLCFDEATDRYFHSSMEKIRGAVNKINEQIHDEDYADASDFYHLLGLKGTEWSKQVGWNRDHMLAVKYDTVTSPDGRPCLAIEFSNFPRPDFIQKHT